MENVNTQTPVTLQNKLGKTIEVKLGFCGITLLLGFIFALLAPIPDLLKGNFKPAMLVYLAIFIFFILFTISGLGQMVGVFGFLGIVITYSVFRNKYLLQYYLNNGYCITRGVKEEVDEVLGYITSDGVWK